MANPKRGPDGVLKAHSIKTVMCEHGVLTIYLQDPKGEVFATAQFDAHGVGDLMEDLGNKMETFLRASGLLFEDNEATAPPDGKVH